MIKEYRTIQEVNGPLMVVRRVSGVTYDELGEIELANGETRRCKVLEIDGGNALVQLFENSTGINLSNSKVRFLGRTMELGVSEDMLGRVFDGLGRPIDGGPEILPEERRDINGLPMNGGQKLSSGVYPDGSVCDRRTEHTGKRPEAADFSAFRPSPRQSRPAQIARPGQGKGNRRAFAVVFAAMGITFEEAHFFEESFKETGAIDRTVLFINLANDPAVERIATRRWP